MKTVIRTFLSGALIIVPLAITAWVLYSVGSWMDLKGRAAVAKIWGEDSAKNLFSGAGALLLIAVIYLTGLLTRVWAFRTLWGYFERLLAKVPGVKVIYESVRDLMKLFGGGAGSMGRVVEYRPPGTDVAVLGILTNEFPSAGKQDGEPKRVAVYLPMAYMFGGATILTPLEHLKELDMTVEHALKLAATAHIGGAGTEFPAKKGK
jgi:uncharacterized membrane protein